MVFQRHTFLIKVGNIEHREAAADVAGHGDLLVLGISVIVDQTRDHVRGESHNKSLGKNRNERTFGDLFKDMTHIFAVPKCNCISQNRRE